MSEPGNTRLLPTKPIDPDLDLPSLERAVLERWREYDVYRESLKRRQGSPRWTFYEGPPTANGPPGAHHVLSRVFKDIYPRFQTMRGHLVERKGGWDCHGLPVEIAVEQKLGVNSKAQIENEVGIERFNAECRESVFSHVQDWNRLTERIGFWIDLDDAYRTLDESYIESVWWALRKLHDKQLLYEAHKVVPYCYRCQTALSSHEVALGYRDVVDESVYVQLPLSADGALEVQFADAAAEGGRRSVSFAAEDALLIWTTTPWTLPGNVAVAVGPDIEYVRARIGGAEGQVLILAAARVQAVLGEQAEILDRFPGCAIAAAGPGEALRYGSPIFGSTQATARSAPLIAAAFVSTDDGTGLVHIAPAFGAEDFEAATAAGLFDPHDPRSLPCPVRLDGSFDESVLSCDGSRSYAGRQVKDAQLTGELIADLQSAGLLFRRVPYEHSYPHCWRCGKPLIYLAKVSWYIRTSAFREALLAANESVTWHPQHVKHGRFGEWLRGNIDWALSRERFWGTPLPVWRCQAGHIHVIGSYAELRQRSGRELSDHHRPFVDDADFPCAQDGCSGTMQRVPDVIDVWFDSGAMPFAQHHWPFAEQGAGERPPAETFPADFICEALDQTRGWFYSLLAISTLLFGESPYRNVVCLGLILDAEGQKMSKSKGNTVEPWELIERHGADAFRWYLFTAKAPWDGYRFSEEAIGEQVRLFFKPLWSAFHFYALYANANAAHLQALQGAADDAAPPSDLDRWALARTTQTALLVAERLEDYDATTAGRAIAELLDDISNWYIRRSRRRFWDGEIAAFRTLRSCLLNIAKLLAPFCPFIAEEIYCSLDDSERSVHLCDFPEPERLDQDALDLLAAMQIARQSVRLGLAARAHAKIKVRQPLSEAVIVAAGQERTAIEGHAELIREELNVRKLRFVEAADELGSYEVKPDYRRLGPRFGRQMPLVAEAVAALDGGNVATALAGGSEVGVNIGGHEHLLGTDDLLLSMRAPEGFAVEREGAHAVALDLQINDDLLAEGRAREIVRTIQNARRNAGLAVEDRIELWLEGEETLLQAARDHAEHLRGETLTRSLSIGGIDDAPRPAQAHSEQLAIDGMSLTVTLRRCAHGNS